MAGYAPVAGYPVPGAGYGAPAAYPPAPVVQSGYPPQPGYPPQSGYPPQPGYPGQGAVVGPGYPPAGPGYSPAVHEAGPQLPTVSGFPPPAAAVTAFPPPAAAAATASAVPAGYPGYSGAPAVPSPYPPQQSPGADFSKPPSYQDVLTQSFASPLAPQALVSQYPPPVVPTTGVWRLLQHGNKVHLISAASKKSLRINLDGQIDGRGGSGGLATFFVEHLPDQAYDVIRLRNHASPHLYLGIIKGRLCHGTGGDNESMFRVHLHGKSDVISLESLVAPNEHVGIIANGAVRPATHTRRGPNGQFTVAPSVVGDPTMPTPAPTMPTPAPAMPAPAPNSDALWRTLQRNPRVHLYSVASKRTLRILGDGKINALGAKGDAATFDVEHPRPDCHDIIRLRNAKNPQFYVNIIANQLVGSNGLTDTSVFRVHCHGDELISLESVAAGGQHVGILPSGQCKPANQTGRGPHGQFTLKLHGDVEQSAVWNKLYPEARIQLLSLASQTHLRILADGCINGLGGVGMFAKFAVERPAGRPGDVIRLRSVPNPQFYVNIIQGQLVASNGATDTSLLRVQPNKGSDNISLESVVCPGQHVGVVPGGSAKPPKSTGRGIHGQFVVIPVMTADQVALLLQPEAKIHLVSCASHGTLRILKNGVINGLGRYGIFATFFVEKPDGFAHDIIRLRSADDARFYVNIIQGQLVASNGATPTSMLRVKTHVDTGHVSLESIPAPGQHVGILPDGQPKPASATGMGEHGQFVLRRAQC